MQSGQIANSSTASIFKEMGTESEEIAEAELTPDLLSEVIREVKDTFVKGNLNNSNTRSLAQKHPENFKDYELMYHYTQKRYAF